MGAHPSAPPPLDPRLTAIRTGTLVATIQSIKIVQQLVSPEVVMARLKLPPTYNSITTQRKSTPPPFNSQLVYSQASLSVRKLPPVSPNSLSPAHSYTLKHPQTIANKADGNKGVILSVILTHWGRTGDRATHSAPETRPTAPLSAPSDRYTDTIHIVRAARTGLVTSQVS